MLGAALELDFFCLLNKMFSFKPLQALGDVIIYISVEQVTVLNFETAARKKRLTGKGK